jgi:hypothetical protein
LKVKLGNNKLWINLEAEVLTALCTKIYVFWDARSSSLVYICLLFYN